MIQSSRASRFAIAALIALPFLTACSGGTSGRTQASAPPDLNGVWSAPFTPDISKPLGHQPPFTPYAADLFKKEDEIDDPLTQCLPIGPARGIQAGLMPFQIVQTPTVVALLFENQRTFRIINTDGRSHPKDPDPTWFGDSIGHWEGDTLIVDTVGLNDRTWLDTAGHQHSDVLHVIERFRRIPGSAKVDYEFTVDDSKMYTKPWTNARPLTPLKPTPGLPDLLEYNCEENNRDVQHLRSNKPALQP